MNRTEEKLKLRVIQKGKSLYRFFPSAHDQHLALFNASEKKHTLIKSLEHGRSWTISDWFNEVHLSESDIKDIAKKRISIFPSRRTQMEVKLS